MMSFSEWRSRKPKKPKKESPPVPKNGEIDSFLQSVFGLEKELSDLDILEKKPKKQEKPAVKSVDSDGTPCKPA